MTPDPFPNELVEAAAKAILPHWDYAVESEKILARETARRVLPLIEQRRTREIVEALREPDAMLRIATEGFPASVVIVGQEGIGRPEVAALIREAIAAHLERTFLNGEAPDA
jgi:hypothetical protein